MTLKSGINKTTAIIHGIISLLNLDFKNSRAFLFCNDKGVRNPEIKNTVDITKISIIFKFGILVSVLVEKSNTTQNKPAIVSGMLKMISPSVKKCFSSCKTSSSQSPRKMATPKIRNVTQPVKPVVTTMTL